MTISFSLPATLTGQQQLLPEYISQIYLCIKILIQTELKQSNSTPQIPYEMEKTAFTLGESRSNYSKEVWLCVIQSLATNLTEFLGLPIDLSTCLTSSGWPVIIYTSWASFLSSPSFLTGSERKDWLAQTVCLSAYPYLTGSADKVLLLLQLDYQLLSFPRGNWFSHQTKSSWWLSPRVTK